MFDNRFVGREALEQTGETIACVYFTESYDRNKALQYLKWKGFKTHLLYEFNGFMIFYQKEEFVPNLSVEDQFFKIVSEGNMWENMPNGCEYDYKYRCINTNLICISFIPCLTNAETNKAAGKAKKE